MACGRRVGRRRRAGGWAAAAAGLAAGGGSRLLAAKCNVRVKSGRGQPRAYRVFG
jgi:hypothetical protein